MTALSDNYVQEEIKENAAKAERWFHLLSEEEKGMLMNDMFYKFPKYLREDAIKYILTISVKTHPAGDKVKVRLPFEMNDRPFADVILDFDESTQVFFSHEHKKLITMKDLLDELGVK